MALAEAGFDLLDVGAVPARSGPPVPADEEAARLVPAIEGLVRRAGVPVTADTFQVEVARRALDAGAAAINDISGGADPEMLDLVAERGCGYVLMHIEGPPRVDREPAGHRDPVAHLKRWFGERIEAALARGVAEEQIALDPGLDFDLSVDDDLEILRRLGELRELGRPLFVALSRKDFLGAVLAGSWEDRVAAAEREWATAAATALAVAAARRSCGSTTGARSTRCARRPRSRAAAGRRPADPCPPPMASAGAGVAAAAGWERAIEPGAPTAAWLPRASRRPERRTRSRSRIRSRPSWRPRCARAGIEALYSHQLEALEAAPPGNAIVTSGTASGKSLSFNLPVLDELVRDDRRRALYLYPTKALAQDQARKLSALGLPQLRHAIYDGDTPRDDRPQIRRRSNLILTNPDMLHVGILPHHKSWGDFLASLGWVVVDEAHTYRGVFGSHVANVLRRLRRVAGLLRRRARGSSSPRRRSPTRSSSPSGWSASPSGWSTPTALRAPGGGSRCGTRR